MLHIFLSSVVICLELEHACGTSKGRQTVTSQLWPCAPAAAARFSMAASLLCISTSRALPGRTHFDA
ncbi:hypothetical protein I7I48_12032 [Histoplasma ohiense]|nr:hypothetical protein I7I48_12032 [Histoplasma ohiense (nom. inval.)]